MSSGKLPPERRPIASAADAVERLARIVNAAERAAASVIDDAEEEAHRQLDEARARADRIVAERLRELADQLDPQGAGPESRLRPVESNPPAVAEPSTAGERPSAAEPLTAAEPSAAERFSAPEPPAAADPPAAGARPADGGADVNRPPESAWGRPLVYRRSEHSDARLLATQLAVSGAGRREIEARLSRDFDIDNTSEILDAILGPEE
jgi:hypothetical protein